MRRKKMKRSRRVLLGLAVVALVTTVLVFPAKAQLHEMEKGFVSPQGKPLVSVQSVQPQCTTLCSECFWLNMYDPNNAPAGDFVVHTTLALDKGVMYLITIRGTYTVWPESWWVAPGQGAVESAPMYPSSGAENWAAFADWEFLFGYYRPIVSPSLPKPIVWNGISLDGGVTYDYITPIGGHTYNSAHAYEYLVTGKGAKAYFWRHDYPTNDNSGMFKICVQKVTFCGSID
jgi:hypothetical protein